MKFFSMLFIFVILISSCAPAAHTIAPTPTSAPAITVTFTSPSEPTMTSTPMAMPSATLEPDDFVFEIDPGAPDEDVAEIKLGINLARAYLRDYAGGDITADKRNFVVKIVLNGTGCCTAFDEYGPRPYFDLSNGWNIVSSDFWDGFDHHLNAGAHEYAHIWQGALGCLTTHHSPLPDWLDEGIAQYVSINSLKLGGYVTDSDITQISYEFSRRIKNRSLALYEVDPPVWPGDIGFLAVKKLIAKAPNGPLALRMVCEGVAAGKSVDESFENAFGISKEEFYKIFH